jgi:hypothetical protein
MIMPAVYIDFLFPANTAKPHREAIWPATPSSHVIPSEVEEPLKCGERHPSRRGPSTALRMTPFGCLSPDSVTRESFH